MTVFMFRISAIGIGLLFFNQGLLAKCTMLSFDAKTFPELLGLQMIVCATV